LIDIIFFLLATFVMVSLAMIKNKGISVQLPSSSSGGPLERAQSVTLTVTREGSLYWDKTPVQVSDLASKLEQFKEKPGSSLIINGDEGASFGVIVKLLDEIRGKGVSDVSIQTRPTPIPK
jgi:biopolymer transport protein ExbD